MPFFPSGYYARRVLMRLSIWQSTSFLALVHLLEVGLLYYSFALVAVSSSLSLLAIILVSTIMGHM